MHSLQGLPFVVEECLTCSVRREEAFCALSRESLETVDRLKHEAAYREGVTLFMEDDAPRGVFMLCQGRVKLFATFRDGTKRLLRIARQGEMLGLHACISGRPYEYAVMTMQPCQLTFMDRRAFLNVLSTHSDACLCAALDLARDCQFAQEALCCIYRVGPTAKRLARFFLNSAADGRVRDGTVEVPLALTHEDISQVIGTRREAVTRQLRKFKYMQVAELRSSTLIIRDKAALERFVSSCR